jgi:hypothetical protein
VHKVRYTEGLAGRKAYRKGFTHVSLQLGDGTELDFINAHLFHDQSNLRAIVH